MMVREKLIFLALLLFSTKLFAQSLNGQVIDSLTRLPIANAQINNKAATVFSDENGKYLLSNVAVGDRISIRIMGYETLELKVALAMFSGMVITKLKPQRINLSEVNIRTTRNYKRDSLDLRREYAAIFNHKAPKFTDAFIKIDPSYKSPHANINPNSTASIIKLNVLQLVGLIGKNKEPSSKLKETLIRDEQDKHIDQVFSKKKIETIITLSGDSLNTFMRQYRPTFEQLKRMNEYQLILYVKKSYGEFLRLNQ